MSSAIDFRVIFLEQNIPDLVITSWYLDQIPDLGSNSIKAIIGHAGFEIENHRLSRQIARDPILARNHDCTIRNSALHLATSI